MYHVCAGGTPAACHSANSFTFVPDESPRDADVLVQSDWGRGRAADCWRVWVVPSRSGGDEGGPAWQAATRQTSDRDFTPPMSPLPLLFAHPCLLSYGC